MHNLGLIAREAALDISKGICEPTVGEHIPGIANVLADVLSRRLDPRDRTKWKVPPAMEGLPIAEPPPRTEDYYVTLGGCSPSTGRSEGAVVVWW